MKKLIAMLFIALPLHAQFVDNEDKIAEELTRNGNKTIVCYQENLKRRGIRYDDIYSTEMTFTVSGKTIAWNIHLETDKTYIFHTFTSTAKVRVDVYYYGKLVCRRYIKNSGSFTMRSGRSGSYTLAVKTLDGEYGLHFTHVMYLLKPGEKYVWER